MPPPDPHGTGLFKQDLGAPYTNFTYAWAGCWQMIFTSPPPLEMLLDNLEYDVYHPPHLEIARATNGVDLTWLLPMEEHIVVEADQLAGPWCPCPQPYTRTDDVFCLTMPCRRPQKFFRLTPGRQFTDDFSSAVPTWTPWLTSRAGAEWIVTNGVLQLNWHGPLEGGFGLRPPGPDIEVGDFYMSVDILDWMTSGTNWSAFGLAARASLTTALSVGGGLAVNDGGVRGQVRPLVWQNQQETSGPNFDIAQFPPPYRLQFWAVGPNLHFRVLSLTTGQIIREVTETDTTGTQGFVFLWINAPSGQFQSHSITVDNFFLSGTKQ